ncbi:hypothetical protein TIFTF001_050453, partial [Ficus carica]
RSCTYLSCYVPRNAAPPPGTAAGFLLLDEGHRLRWITLSAKSSYIPLRLGYLPNLGLSHSISDVTTGYHP